MHIKLTDILIFLSIIATFLQGDVIKNFTYTNDNITFHKNNNYDQIFYKKFDLTTKIGFPQLPYEIIHLNLKNYSIDSIIVMNVEYEKINGEYNIYPAQQPQILSNQNVIFKPSNLSKISTQKRFPKNSTEILHSGNLSNNRISSIRIFPIKYNSETKELFLLKNLSIKIKTSKTLSFKSNYKPGPIFNKIINKLSNSNYLEEYSNINEDDICEYVIITSDLLMETFQPLQQWKIKKGLSAKIITVEWIENNYSGQDIQEKIRNFIKDYHETKSTQWILLGGDTNIIPDRKAWAFDCEANYATGENQIPCDLYFSDLDGTWNDDGDNIYGEVEDNIDMYPDVFVGRAPVENAIEAETFVTKILSYEKAISTDYQTNMLFLAQILWHDPYTDSGEGKDFIDESYVPDRFDPIAKLYESKNNATTRNALAILNSGTNIINHDGHAWYTTMSLGDGRLGYNEMSNLTNKDKYSIIYSIGCWPAAFDKHAVAEDFITNPEGGGVAFVGNSRYGWGSPGNALYGYSDRFDQQFFKQLFINDIPNIGATLAAAKSYYVPLSGRENVYRWCQYEINLLGDPEMMIYTDLPKKLDINFPNKISEGEQNFNISVTTNNKPVENCTICLYQENGTYFVATTESDGIINFEGNISNSSDKIYLTATAHNFIPLEDSITVITNSAFLTFSNITNSELFSNIMQTNKDLFISPTLINNGNKKAENIQITLSSSNPKITIIDSICTIQELLSQNSTLLENAFTFQINEEFYSNEEFLFHTKMKDNIDNEWQTDFAITGKLPDLAITNISINKKILSPDDDILCTLYITNKGQKFCEKYEIIFENNDLYEINNINHITSGLIPNEIDTAIVSIKLSSNIDSIEYITANIIFETISQFQMQNKIFLNVGEFGFEDDFEDNSNKWTKINKDSNQWHRSSLRKYSGDYSYYCGDESSQSYNISETENIIESDYFYPGKDGKLSFYCWYNFPNYGFSGMRVEIFDNDDWKILDFIGSGGALGILPTGNDWIKYEYNLSFLPDFAKTKLRFKVNVDIHEDVTEGIYIDNIQVQNEIINFTKIEKALQFPNDYQLFQNFPNPFNPTTNIKFSLIREANVKINIYNIRGKLIDKLINKQFSAGTHSLNWNAKNFSSGIYFYKLETEKYTEVKKCILIR